MVLLSQRISVIDPLAIFTAAECLFGMIISNGKSPPPSRL
jgi:hypothetical protein